MNQKNNTTDRFKNNLDLLYLPPKDNRWRVYHVESEKFQTHIDSIDEISGQRHAYAEQWIIVCPAAGDPTLEKAHAFFWVPENRQKSDAETEFEHFVRMIDATAKMTSKSCSLYRDTVLGYTSGVSTDEHPVLVQEQAETQFNKNYSRPKPLFDYKNLPK